MIFVHDKGRLANNILQYGHVYAWGREHGRQTVSMRFSYKYPWFHICSTRHHHFLTYVFAKYAAKLKLIPTSSAFMGSMSVVSVSIQKIFFVLII